MTRIMLSRLIYNLYIRLRLKVARHDMLYRSLILGVSLFRPRQNELIVTKDTDLVIEGFPRCANTFFVEYVALAAGDRLVIAHHLHEAYQIRFAARNAIPIVVLIREPLPAIASAMLRDSRVCPSTLFNMYIEFYSQVYELLGHVLLVNFKTATSLPAEVLKTLEARFDLKVDTQSLSENQVFLRVEALDRADQGESLNEYSKAIPSAEKRDQSRKLQHELTTKYPEAVACCEDLYKVLIDESKWYL